MSGSHHIAGDKPWTFSGYPDSESDKNASSQDDDAMQGIIQGSTESHDGVHASEKDHTQAQSLSSSLEDGDPHEHATANIDSTNGSNVEADYDMDGLETSGPSAEDHPGEPEYPPGFSDEEGGDLFGDMNRTYSGFSNQNQTMNHNKSPRRSDDDDSESGSSPKKPKTTKSLFGNGEMDRSGDDEPISRHSSLGNPLRGGELPASEDEDSAMSPQRRILSEADGGDETPTESSSPKHNLKEGMSNLNLTQDDEEIDIDILNTHGGTSSHVGSYQGGFATGPESKSLAGDQKSAYPFRTNIDRHIAGSHIDWDKSGDYNPDEDPEEGGRRKKTAKAKKKTEKPAKSNKSKATAGIRKLIVRLRFGAMGTVLNITDGYDNWPPNWSDLDSEDEREKQREKEAFRYNTPGREPQQPIEDPAGLLDDLTGHPIARGCKSCRRNGEDCTMVTEGTWPCKECRESGDDCEPIIKFVTKGRCNRCEETCGQDEENYCSFEMTGLNPHETCHQCAKAGFTDCTPGPPEEYLSPRIDLDRILYGPDRKWVNCTNCRANKKKCSVKSKAERGPCRQCKRAKIGCTFYDAPPATDRPSKRNNIVEISEDEPESSKTGAKRGGRGTVRRSPLPQVVTRRPAVTAEDLADLDEEEDLETEREPSPDIEMEDAQGHSGVVTQIDTSFAHPIQFNSDADCDFCEMPVFGFVGLFEKTVDVIKWSDGLGYTELHGGHGGQVGGGGTHMCSECTGTRLQIVSCDDHQIKRIAIDQTLPDAESAADLLISAEPRSAETRRLLQQWCSMCFSVATFQCRLSQIPLCTEGGIDDQGMIEGCGLRLCDACHERLQTEFNGSTDAMATALERMPKAKEGADEEGVLVRADVGFLKSDGLLMKNIEVIGLQDGSDDE